MNLKQLSQPLRELNSEVDNYLGRSLRTSPDFVSLPVIALTSNLTEQGSAVARAYSDAVIKAGGVPMILPVTDDLQVLSGMLERVDGLILTGGPDLYPAYMGEEPLRGLGEVCPDRDRYELLLINLATRFSIPILGICRGHQLLGIAFGSTLFQDLSSQYTVEDAIDHSPRIPRTVGAHSVSFLGMNSRLARLLSVEEDAEIYVNSLHHQALREVCPPFCEVAIARDGVNEGIDAYPELDILAVQWHPEQMVAGGDGRQLACFTHIVDRARLYRRARKFHQRYISLDSHTDTPMFFTPEFDLGKNEITRVDLTKMEVGDIDATVMVAYLPQGSLTEEAYQEAQHYVEQRFAMLESAVEAYGDRVVITRTAEEVGFAKSCGKRAIIPAIENGYAIGDNLDLIKYYRDRYGVVYMTLCHNGDNALCDSACKSKRTYGGLSPLGREAVVEMNRKGVIVDVSHASEDTVADVLSFSYAPIVASHSSAWALCQHPRNLTDEQLCAIADKGGVIQICLYAGFIKDPDSERASYLDAVEHIEHVISVVGIEHVGIGSDFDGDGELVGCRTSEDLIKITMELLDRGYSEDELALIWGGNFLRVMKQAEHIAVSWRD